MHVVIYYDTQFGNTQKIAEAIAVGASKHANVDTVHIQSKRPMDWSSVDMLIVGSPTQGGMGTQHIREFVNNIPAHALVKKKAAAFDTRFDNRRSGFGLKFLMYVLKYAAEKIARSLEKATGNRVPSEGFYVQDKKGPLKEGEIERAQKWGEQVTRT